MASLAACFGGWASLSACDAPTSDANQTASDASPNPGFELHAPIRQAMLGCVIKSRGDVRLDGSGCALRQQEGMPKPQTRQVVMPGFGVSGFALLPGRKKESADGITSCLLWGLGVGARQVDVRLPGKGDSNSHGARPVHLIITMIKWIRTSRLSIKNSLSRLPGGRRRAAMASLVACFGVWHH